MKRVLSSLQKTFFNPIVGSVFVAVIILGLLGLVLYRRFHSPTGQGATVVSGMVSLKQLQDDQAFFNFATDFQNKLKKYRQQFDQYPVSYKTANIDVGSYGDKFKSDKITYEVRGSDYNYEVCVKINLVYNQPCFTKFSFLVDPRLVPNQKPQLSDTELQSTKDQAISIAETWDWSKDGEDALLTKLYLSASESAEFKIANAMYHYQTGYITNREFYKDDWDVAHYYATKAEEAKSDELQLLRLQILMSRWQGDRQKAEGYLNTLLEKYPNSDWTKYFLVTKIPQSSARITALKKLTGELSDKSVLWDSYWSLLEECACAGRKVYVSTTVQKMIDTFGAHPWLYQYQGNLLYSQGKYEEAIVDYQKGIAAGDIPALHTNLANAYADYGYITFYYQKHDYDKAIEYINKAIQENALSGGDLANPQEWETRQYNSYLITIYEARGMAKKNPDDLKKALEYVNAIIDKSEYSYGYDEDKQRLERELKKFEK